MTGRALFVVAVISLVALAADAIVAFAILDEWGEGGVIVINLVGFASILTLLAVGVAALQRWRKA